LYTVNVPAVSLNSCIEALGVDIYDTNICAGGVYGEDSCQGDSGGPMTMAVDSVEILYGIVSWGVGCATSKPAVYTAVAMYREWIQKNTGIDLGYPGSSRANYEIYIILGCVFGALLVLSVIVFICCFCFHQKLKKETKRTIIFL